MKIIAACALALCLLSVSCKEESNNNQTTKSTTSTTSTTTTATASASPTETTATANLRKAQGAALATALRVTFKGMITFVVPTTTGAVQRAVVLRVPKHKPTISFPLSLETQLKKVFKTVSCGIECAVDIDNVAFQIVDANKAASTGPFNSAPSFTRNVTRLSLVPLPVGMKGAFDPANMQSDLFDKPKPSNLIAGYFSINDGTGSAVAFHCLAHFGTDLTTSQSFPDLAMVDFTLSPNATLQANISGTGWVDVVDITSLGGSPEFHVNNNMGGYLSDFDSYKGLSKNAVTLPAVNKDISTCQGGDVPGCSDTQWP